jgi:hypothetical protein
LLFLSQRLVVVFSFLNLHSCFILKVFQYWWWRLFLLFFFLPLIMGCWYFLFLHQYCCSFFVQCDEVEGESKMLSSDLMRFLKLIF